MDMLPVKRRRRRSCACGAGSVGMCKERNGMELRLRRRVLLVKELRLRRGVSGAEETGRIQQRRCACGVGPWRDVQERKMKERKERDRMEIALAAWYLRSERYLWRDLCDVPAARVSEWKETWRTELVKNYWSGTGLKDCAWGNGLTRDMVCRPAYPLRTTIWKLHTYILIDWLNEGMTERMHECMNTWIHIYVTQLNEWMNEWKTECMNEWIHDSIYMWLVWGHRHIVPVWSSASIKPPTGIT
jgi:hypothetical protein